MRILIFGAGGMLGHKLVQVLSSTNDVHGTFRDGVVEHPSLDSIPKTISLPEFRPRMKPQFDSAIETTSPDVVINAIGIIKQLPDSKNVITTLTINSIFPHRLAQLAAEFGFRLITISTDCVFRGDRGNYSEDDIPDAVDLYGKSKNLGEVTSGNCLTLRTSIIGHELGSAHSLVDWFLSNSGGKVKGYANAIYSGFPTVVFASIINNLIHAHPELSGLYHVSSDAISKYDLLTLINDAYDAGSRSSAMNDFRIDRSLDSTRFRTRQDSNRRIGNR
jgi:dTDP-4-dehydrorhamnose reductase